MDARALLSAVRTGWWRILARALVGRCLAALVTVTSTTLYSSSTRLVVSASGVTDTTAAYEGDLRSQRRVASHAELRNLALGGVLGLLVGLTLAVARTRLDDTVKDGRQVRESTGSPLLGVIPEDARFVAEHVLTGSRGDDLAITGERIRAIRTSLQFLDVDRPPRVIVVTSSLPDGRGYGGDCAPDPDRTTRVPAALGRLRPAQRAGSR